MKSTIKWKRRILQVFEHVDMVTTDILATFLMAAAAQQCKRRAAVAKLIGAESDGPARAGAPPLAPARSVFFLMCMTSIIVPAAINNINIAVFQQPPDDLSAKKLTSKPLRQ